MDCLLRLLLPHPIPLHVHGEVITRQAHRVGSCKIRGFYHFCGLIVGCVFLFFLGADWSGTVSDGWVGLQNYPISIDDLGKLGCVISFQQSI